MSLVIELSPEIERQLLAEADRAGQGAAEFARAVLERQLGAARCARAHRVNALMAQWNEEDAANPDPDPLWRIEPVTMGEVSID